MSNEETQNTNVSLHIGDCTKYVETLSSKSINMIYLDPPFNSDRNYTMSVDSNIGFTDKWTDASYEQFLESVIPPLKKVLTDDGTLFFHISAACMFIPEKVLRNHFPFVTPIFWKKCRSKNNVKNKLGATIDIIFKCNLKEKHKFNVVTQEKDATYLKNSFKNSDELRGNYSLGHIVTEKTKRGYLYEFSVDGLTFNPPSGWRIKESELIKLRDEKRLHIPKKAGSNLYKKIYLSENPGKPCTDLWDDIHSISQGNEGRKYPTAKPVKLIERLIEISTCKGDLILDPMCGSGTTASACVNTGRNCTLNDINPDITEIVQSRVPSGCIRLLIGLDQVS
jgi:site-specific DNA-methyltransferase (adenine-specific)